MCVSATSSRECLPTLVLDCLSICGRDSSTNWKQCSLELFGRWTPERKALTTNLSASTSVGGTVRQLGYVYLSKPFGVISLTIDIRVTKHLRMYLRMSWVKKET